MADALMTRTFPTIWKCSFFRQSLSKTGRNYYECPICKKHFDHTQLDCLFGDHIWPYSLMGETSKENYQLLCGACNSRKKDFVNNEVRKILGDGSFRGMVLQYLTNHIDRINVPHDMKLEDYISRKQ